MRTQQESRNLVLLVNLSQTLRYKRLTPLTTKENKATTDSVRTDTFQYDELRFQRKPCPIFSSTPIEAPASTYGEVVHQASGSCGSGVRQVPKNGWYGSFHLRGTARGSVRNQLNHVARKGVLRSVRWFCVGSTQPSEFAASSQEPADT